MKQRLIEQINNLLHCKVTFDELALEVFKIDETLEEKLKELKRYK